jgi:hypothetical protein
LIIEHQLGHSVQPDKVSAAMQTAAPSFSGAFAPIVHDRRDAPLRSFPNLHDVASTHWGERREARHTSQ